MDYFLQASADDDHGWNRPLVLQLPSEQIVDRYPFLKEENDLKEI
jgi:hypothetical protein